MSYRDPKVIDDKSGLIIPNAIAAGVANIAKQWGAELGRQRDLNLKNRKEDLANDNRVEDEMAEMKASLKNHSTKGPIFFVNKKGYVENENGVLQSIDKNHIRDFVVDKKTRNKRSPAHTR